MSGRSSLNHIYRTVWNQSLGAMVAVAEIASAGGRSTGASASASVSTFRGNLGLRALAAGIALAWGSVPFVAMANPTGGVAVVGQATMATSGNNLLVTTQNGAGTNHSAINWQSFSIPQGSTTFFQQPSASSTSINRVVTNTPSQLFGNLGSNGNLVLVNQAGITVGAGAVVDTAGFTASSLQMSDADALAGRMRFGGSSGSGGGVSMAGTVLARSGDVVLIGSSIDTGKDALIQAPNGATILVAGSAVSISSRGLEGINFDVQAGANSAVNLGTLKGDAVGIFAGTLKHSGQIQAQAVRVEGGKVVLKATELAEISGSTKAVGVNDLGGVIHATADKVWLKGTASLDASAPKGGGEVLVGGGWQGRDARLANAKINLVSEGASIKVDATEQGDAGTAVVWADGTTRFLGQISAKGGAMGGNGGNVEVSGKDFLDFRGSADLLAPFGKAGSLLLDPATLTIQAAGPVDADGNGTTGDDLAGLTLTSSIGASVITAGALESQLLSGSVTLQAPGDINVNAPITYSGYGGTVLTLQSTSSGSVTTNSPITTSGGSLSLNLSASGGNIAVNNITSNGGAVTLSATSGTLTVNGALNAGSGSVSLTGTSGISLNSAVTSGILSLTSTNAAINQTASSITASGAATISSGSGDITLAQANDFQDGVSATGGKISIRDSNVLSMTSIVNGTNKEVEIRAGGALTLPSSAIATGTANLTLESGASFSTPLGALSGANIALTTTSANSGLTLSAAVNATGTLTLNSSSSIDDSANAGSVTANALSITASEFVSLTNPSNQVNSITATTSGTDQVRYWNNGAMSLGAITSAGSLELKSGGGSITQTGAVQVGVGKTTSIDTGAGNITLTTAGNTFRQLGVTSSGSVDIVDSGAVQMFGSLSTGTFKLKAGGNVDISSSISTTSGAIDIQSDQVLTVGSAEGVNSAGALTLRGLTGLTVSGADLTANGGGNVLLDSGTGTFLAGGYGGSVTLNGGGAWRTHSVVSGSNDFSMFPDANAGFKQYGAAYNSTPLGTGNARLYSDNPVLGSARTLSGSISKVYDGSTSIGLSGAVFAAVSGGEVDGDVATGAVISGGTGTLSDPNVATGKLVTASGMTVSGVTFAGSKPVFGYQVGSFTGNIAEVTPARAIASINLAGTRVYDGTNIVNAPIFTLSGLVGSETLGLLGSGTVADKNVGTNKPVSLGSLSLSDGSGLASNYTLSGGTAVATISPVAIGSVTGITATNKVYDGTTTATVSTSGAVLAGKVVGDVLGVTATAAAFVDKNVGLGKQIGVAGLVLNGADAANYRLTSTLGTAAASIVAKPLTLGAVSAANKVYDGTAAAVVSGGTLSGVVAGDSVSLGALSGTFVDKNVGAAKQVTVAGLALSGADALNYNLLSTTVTASADITAKALIAGAFSALNKTYDGTRVASVSGGALSGTVAGDSVSLSPFVGSFADKAAGVSKAVTIDGLALSGADAGNYSLAKTTGTATASIAPKALSASGFVAANKIYDGAVAATVTGGVLSGAVAGDSVGLGLVTASFDSKNAGVAKLVTVSTGSLSGADAGNYSLSNAGPALRANIEAKPVSVSGLAAANKVYDGTLAASVTGGSVVGAFAGDAVGVSIASSTFADKNKGTGKAVTVTGIALAGADATNYALSTTGAVLSANIAAKPLTVGNVVASSKVYDGNSSAVVSGGNLVGAIAGDNVSLGALSGSFLDKNAGNNKPVIVSGLVLGGADGGNYSLAANSVSTTANITRKLLDVSALTAANKIYDGGTVATLSGGALSGAVVGDSIALAPAVGAFADKNVGTNKSVSISGLSLTGADVANYSLSAASLSTTASIAPKPLVVSGITASSKEYDGKTDAAIVTSAAVMGGLVAGDAVTTGAITAAFADKNAGVGKKVLLTGLGLIGADAGNYTFSSDSVTTADIRVRPVSNWLGGSSGVWSDVKNWDALPDGSNVLAVNFPAATTNVTLDALAGSVSLQSLNLGGTLSVTGGSLQVASSVTTAGYAQTGGAVSSAGAFKVTGPFDQAGGTLAAGNVEVVRPAGDILVGNIRSDNVSLSAPSGAIREAGAIQGLASGPGASLITKSATGTLLNDAGNRLSSFTAENLGTGNIELVNKGILTTSGIRNTGGNITVVNTGGVTSLDTGRIIASGPGAKISLIANSPLTIGAAGVSADGDIELVATNLTSAGNITLNGPIESVAGSVAFTAANDLTQNSSVLAPLGVRAAAGGTLTLGPAATSGYQPVSYQVNSVPVIPPRPPTSTSTTSDLVVALMSIATEPVVDRTVAALEGLASTDKDKDRDRDSSKAAIVSEGQICRP
jgi:filamentous hemagglutinin family protein